MNPAIREALIKEYEADIERIKGQLVQLESGWMGSNNPSQPIDITDAVIAGHKRIIEEYQSILSALKSDKSP